jgi:hypothetical protein
VSEVRAGDDLADLLAAGVELEEDDIVLLSSMVVTRSEGRVVEGSRLPAAPVVPLHRRQMFWLRSPSSMWRHSATATARAASAHGWAWDEDRDRVIQGPAAVGPRMVRNQ